MSVIHKFQFPSQFGVFSGYVEGLMHRPLAFQMQDGKPTLWAEVIQGTSTRYSVHLVPTGGFVPGGTEYVGTVQADGGIVCHCYVGG